MRKIKFRKWDYENKEMIDGDSLAFEEYAPICDLLTQDGIMQYTGLEDKNGTEIYEGDILKHKWHCGYNDWREAISEVKWHEVKWHNGAFVVDDKKRVDWLLSLHACADSWACFEVIGNIYENPELWKVSKNITEEG
jgi:uncharacterized phage protein (TIGR01671 family)